MTVKKRSSHLDLQRRHDVWFYEQWWWIVRNEHLISLRAQSIWSKCTSVKFLLSFLFVIHHICEKSIDVEAHGSECDRNVLQNQRRQRKSVQRGASKGRSVKRGQGRSVQWMSCLWSHWLAPADNAHGQSAKRQSTKSNDCLFGKIQSIVRHENNCDSVCQSHHHFQTMSPQKLAELCHNGKQRAWGLWWVLQRVETHSCHCYGMMSCAFVTRWKIST